MQVTVKETWFSELLDDIDEAMGNPGLTMHTDYSGRYMFGTQCLGVTVANSSRFMLHLGLAIGDAFLNGDEAGDGLVDALANASTDAMGLNTIVYWPDIQVITP